MADGTDPHRRGDNVLRWQALYKILSVCMAIAFVVVGLLFLAGSDTVLRFFNDLSQPLGLEEAPTDSVNFYLILAGGYMYLVTLLAVLMARFPENRHFPLLLMNGKLASSGLSFVFLLAHRAYLIYLVNGVVDGLIGFIVLLMYLKQRRIVA